MGLLPITLTLETRHLNTCITICPVWFFDFSPSASTVAVVSLRSTTLVACRDLGSLVFYYLGEGGVASSTPYMQVRTGDLLKHLCLLSVHDPLPPAGEVLPALPPHAGHQPLHVFLVPELGIVGAHLLRLLRAQVLDEHGIHYGPLGSCHQAE